jgi:hypothetical protein
MAGLIVESDVEHLDSQSFPRVLNSVITAEADALHVPLGDVDLTIRVHDADAGIDGRATAIGRVSREKVGSEINRTGSAADPKGRTCLLESALMLAILAAGLLRLIPPAEGRGKPTP